MEGCRCVSVAQFPCEIVIRAKPRDLRLAGSGCIVANPGRTADPSTPPPNAGGSAQDDDQWECKLTMWVENCDQQGNRQPTTANRQLPTLPVTNLNQFPRTFGRSRAIYIQYT